MQALLRETWDGLLAELRRSLGDSTYESWFSKLRLLRMERGICHLEAPNRMVGERVQRTYAGMLADGLSRAFGTKVDILVQTAPEALMPDRFEVGPSRPLIDASNRTVWLALQALVEGKPMPASLFFFYGPTGSGKTFLIDWWRRAWPNSPALSFDGDGLLRAFQAVSRDGRKDEFIEELSNPERPLVLDEIHRIAGREKLQDAVMKILGARSAEVARPTLLASRWHPAEIWKLDASLSTWLLSGFVAQIELPGPAARLGYLRALEGAPARNGRAAEIERMARDVRGSYRDLRFAWARHKAQPAGSRPFQLIEPRSAFERIVERVAAAMDVERADLVGPGQKRRVSQARKVLAWLCVRDGLSRAEVGRFLGRTRAAISYAVQSLDEALEKDEDLRTFVEGIDSGA